LPHSCSRSRPKGANRFAEQAAPVLHQVEDARENDRVEGVGRERQRTAFGAQEPHGHISGFAAQRGEHRERRLESGHAEAECGERQRHAAGTGADIEDRGAGTQSGDDGPRRIRRQQRTTAGTVIINAGSRRKVDVDHSSIRSLQLTMAR
jgi:hypothetical protein